MQVWVVPVVIGGGMMLFGLLIVADGLRRTWTGLVLRGDWANAGSVDSGPAKLSGTTATRDGTVTAPFSGRECLAYRAAIENVNNPVHNTTTEVNWNAYHTVEETSPFELSDATGTVTVDLDGSDWSLPNDHTHIVNGGEAPDGPYEAFVDEHDVYTLDDENIVEAHDVRFTETRIEPGDEFAVVGPVDATGAERRIEATGSRVVPSPFSIAETKDNLDESGEGGVLLAAFGLLFVLVPAVFLWGIF